MCVARLGAVANYAEMAIACFPADSIDIPRNVFNRQEYRSTLLRADHVSSP